MEATFNRFKKCTNQLLHVFNTSNENHQCSYFLAHMGETTHGRNTVHQFFQKVSEVNCSTLLARTAHKCLLQKRSEGDLCWILPHVPLMTQWIKGLNWTGKYDNNIKSLTLGQYYLVDRHQTGQWSVCVRGQRELCRPCLCHQCRPCPHVPGMMGCQSPESPHTTLSG